MRLFGILLIFAILAAGAGFVYLSTQDWKGRQTISAVGLRHLLVLQGLPLEGQDLDQDPEGETPFVMEMGGGESTKTISKKLLENYFRDNTATAPPAPVPDPTAPPPPPRVSLTKDAPIVTNQLAEVKRVQALIKAELAKDGVADPTKISLLGGWLLFQAENLYARTTYIALASLKDANGADKTPEQLKNDAKKLEEILDARFNAVLGKPDGTQAAPAIELPDLGALADNMKKRQGEMDTLTKEEDKVIAGGGRPDDKLRLAIQAKRTEIQAAEKALADGSKEGKSKVDQSAAQRVAGTPDEGERRARLAHLLVHLDQDPVWQKRVSVIVGMRRYVKAISSQVLRFKDMIDEVELGVPGDQAAFSKHETQLREQAIQNAERAKAIADERAKLVEQKTKDDDAVARQRTQLKDLTDQLNKIRLEVDELLVRQSDIEKQLFEIQREVGLTLEEVYRLEELLDATERERFNLLPRAKP